MAKSAKYWLLKTEPETCSIDDILKMSKSTTGWDGVRNYQARNFLRDELKPGDSVIIYHSSTNPPHAAGIGEVASQPYPDPSQFNAKHDGYDPKATKEKPIWFQVDVRAMEKFAVPVPLDQMRNDAALVDMKLFKASRLSVQPVTAAEYKRIVALGSKTPTAKKRETK